MSAQLKKSTWPLICILGCLFVLSLAAPRAWEHAARRQAAAELLEQAVVTETPATEITAPAPERAQLSPQPPVVPTQALVAADETASATAPESQVAEPAEKIASHPVDFDDPTASASVIDDDQQPGAEAWSMREQASAAAMSDAPESQASSEELEPAGPALLVAVAPKADVATREPAPLLRLPAAKSPSAEPPAVQAAPVEKAVVAEQRWKMPASLVERLKRLRGDRATAAWALETEREFEQLVRELNAGSDHARRLFAKMQQHAERGEKLADKSSASVAGELRRTSHAVARRVDIWKMAWEATRSRPLPASAAPIRATQLIECLANLKGIDGHSPMSEAWQQYLLVEKLKASAERSSAEDQQETRRLARQVLVRLIRTPLDERQRTLVEGPSVVALRRELERCAAEPVSLAATLDAVERFEQSGLASDGRQVAENQFRLSFSPVEAERQFARGLDGHYRNANARIVLTKTLINRLLPEPKMEYEPVRDTVLGYPVRGRSWTQPKLAVEFISDPDRLLMNFQVKGWISSSTASTAGPATFYDSSEAFYEANKQLEIEAGGIHLQPAVVTASSDSRLRGLRTNFDAIPILGAIVQNIARSQHEQSKPLAAAEVEWKITARAQERIDTEAYSRVSGSVDRLRERVFVPLNDLQLNPVMIEARTSNDRMTMRLRLAGDDQLGSQTPRPRAPADSLASIQLHETAINNLLERLELDGRTFTVAELSKHVSERLHREAWPVNTERDNVTIRFAAENSIAVRCQDGRVTLTLAIAELRSPPRVWRDFRVRVSYRPVINGRSAELARDGVVQLIGRLSTGSQIAVRGIFSKTFSKDDRVPLAPEWMADDPRLAEMAVGQFVIDDGWVSLAYGPVHATASRRLFERRAR